MRVIIVVECVLLWAAGDCTKLRRRHAAFGKSKSDAAAAAAAVSSVVVRYRGRKKEEENSSRFAVVCVLRAAREETIGAEGGDGEVVHRKDRSISWNNEEYQERSERR